MLILKRPYWIKFISLAVWFFFGLNNCLAEGGLSISQTRVVFGAKEKNTKVTLINNSDRVYLINSRVLASPDTSNIATEVMPFMVTPPVFRLEENSRNTVLIARGTTSALPKDRESVFYLSFLAIPSVKKNVSVESAEGSSITQVSFGIRTLIKLFYRPDGLTFPVSASPEKLTFTQQGTAFQVTNPTPYYQTLARLMINQQPVNVREQGAMIAPFSHQSYQVSGVAHDIQWSVINDFGGLSETFQRTQ